ncbi:MAG: thiolase family protein [Desulfomonilaceae bacterium]|nr:thiolase family protein [Desulfomonilaceae bacterium]
MRRVAITEVAQISGPDSKDNFYDQAYRVTREVLDKAGLSRDEVGTIVSASTDVFHGGISCANAYYWESTGSFMKAGTRQDGESMFALHYAFMKILTGKYDTVLVVGLCKGSENPDNDAITQLIADPFYQRPVGLNETTAAAMQMHQYMEAYGATAEQCATVVEKNLGNALRNPYAHRRGCYSTEEVLASGSMCHPLTDLMCAPKSEGFIAMLLAAEDKAREITPQPVWIKGYGCALDTYFLGDRDLLAGQLPNAARRAYKMAGITDPAKEIDLVELCEPYAFQELLWCEQLGLCGRGEGGKLIASGKTRIDGDLPVNPSGGVLATNPYVSRGLQRVVEATLQIRGHAGEHQVRQQVNTAVCHGSTGFAGQCHAVAVIGR